MLNPAALPVLTEFLSRIGTDPRIRSTHIAAFMALYKVWTEANCPDKLKIKGKQLMEKAKISSSATWHKTIRALHEYGYIRYYPTFNKMASSELSFLKPQNSLAN